VAPLLKVSHVTKEFAGLTAVDDVSFNVEKGEIIGLIGPNGAGKTTLFSLIAGAQKVTAGSILFDGKELTKKSANQICHDGIARTFQIVRVLKQMTVKENVIVGALARTNSVKYAKELAEKTLEFTSLLHVKNQFASNLTIADMKRLEIAKSLATQPKLLLLDEVMSGLTPLETKEAVDLVRKINEQGITLFIVEHVMEAILPVSDRVIVLDAGEKITEDSPENVVKNKQVIKAYLGEDYEHA